MKKFNFPSPYMSKSRILEAGLDKEGHFPFISKGSEEQNHPFDQITLNVLTDKEQLHLFWTSLLSQNKTTKTHGNG